MLQRLWFLGCILWTVFVALIAIKDPRDGPVILLSIAAAPWLMGPLILWAARFVFRGDVRPRTRYFLR